MTADLQDSLLAPEIKLTLIDDGCGSSGVMHCEEL